MEERGEGVVRCTIEDSVSRTIPSGQLVPGNINTDERPCFPCSHLQANPTRTPSLHNQGISGKLQGNLEISILMFPSNKGLLLLEPFVNEGLKIGPG